MGQSFHFAPRHRGESFADSLERYEFMLAARMGLASGDRVLDVGCGLGGPVRNIARLVDVHSAGGSRSSIPTRSPERGRDVVRRASGNPALDYVGVGGGTLLSADLGHRA